MEYLMLQPRLDVQRAHRVRILWLMQRCERVQITCRNRIQSHLISQYGLAEGKKVRKICRLDDQCVRRDDS